MACRCAVNRPIKTAHLRVYTASGTGRESYRAQGSAEDPARSECNGVGLVLGCHQPPQLAVAVQRRSVHASLRTICKEQTGASEEEGSNSRWCEQFRVDTQKAKTGQKAK